MSVTLSRRLNIVLPPFETKDGWTYIHSIPVGRTVFDQCYRFMARATTALVTEGMGPITGPSVAAMVVRDEAERVGLGDKFHGLLMPEIKRLTNVAVAGKDQVPYMVACQRGTIDEDQQSEVENILVYFTLASWMRLPDDMSSSMGLDALQTLWKVQITSSTLMEYMSSLQTSTSDENTGERPTRASSAPLSSIAA